MIISWLVLRSSFRPGQGDLSETFLLGKLVGHRAQSPVHKQNDDSNLALYRKSIPDHTNSRVKIDNKGDSYF